MFREPFRRRRCLIPATGFYEWQRAGKAKQPYYFHRWDGQPLALAGLWDSWAGPDTGERLLTWAMLTTGANELLKPVHDRMKSAKPRAARYVAARADMATSGRIRRASARLALTARTSSAPAGGTGKE
jgi:hypothetical protein